MRPLPVGGVLSHSLRSTLDNLSFAFHVSWPWMLAVLPFNVAANAYIFMNQPADPQEVRADILLAQIGLALIMSVAFSSIAVSWHRYVLLDEVPQGLARFRLDGTVWRYLGNTLLIGLMLSAAVIPFALAAAILFAGLGTAASLLLVPAGIAGFLYLLVFSYRLGTKLPSIALGRQDYRFPRALDDTQGNFWNFVGLAFGVLLVLIVASMLIGGLTYVLFSTQSEAALYVAIVVHLAVNWIGTIWTVTLLTSLYGYFAEGRNF
jgi:hypothetical protein